jgi:hypothetical protein
VLDWDSAFCERKKKLRHPVSPPAQPAANPISSHRTAVTVTIQIIITTTAVLLGGPTIFRIVVVLALLLGQGVSKSASPM